MIDSATIMWEILIIILTGFVLYHTMRLVKWIHQVNRTRKESNHPKQAVRLGIKKSHEGYS